MKRRITRPLASISALLLAGVLVGCAQSPVNENVGRNSTLTDAQEKAQGHRDHPRHMGSSQLAIEFGNTRPSAAPALPVGGVRELYEARTFLGTIPCSSAQANCAPIRFTVTFSPNGMWRMRASEMPPSSGSAVAQGCWHQIGSEPTRLVLETSQDTILADLSFVHDQLLRVNVFNYVSPTLETHLSRQQDIDGIDELQNQTGPSCRS